MAIPVVTKSFIPEIQQTQIKRKYGSITDLQFESKISELSLGAEGYVAAFIGNIDKLTDNEWTELKKLYIEWSIYSQIESEEKSKDKLLALNAILTNINKRVNGRTEDKPSSNITAGIEVF